MGVKILFKNIKTLKGEKIIDLSIKSATSLRAKNVHQNLIVLIWFLLIFLVAAKAKISIFRNLSELNQKKVLDFYGDLKSYQKWVKNITKVIA